MFPKKSVLLFAAGWMILSLIALPAHASATASPLTPSTMVIDTFPVFENLIDVRQAHIAWLAAKEDVGMEATIAYIRSVNGSTSTLSTIHESFRHSQREFGVADSHESLDAILQDFRKKTQAFREEAAVRMKASNGIHGDLRQSVQSGLKASTRVKLSEDQYWDVREKTDLAGFDRRVNLAGEMLTAFRSNGYEITAAQEKLTEITAMRNELSTAHSTRNDTGIEQAHKKIHAASIGFVQTVRGLRITTSPDTIIRQHIGQGSAVMTRAGMVNADLKIQGLMNRSTENDVSAGVTLLAGATTRLDQGNTEGAKATLREFRYTVQSLRDSYRSVLIKEDLPLTTAQGVLSVAQSLDITSARLMTL